jgi:hypothetical protein
MSVSRFFFGLSAAAAVAGGATAAGCGSSSSTPGAADDASTRGDTGATVDTGAPTNDGPNTCYVDASLTAFAASDAAGAGCAACVNTMCGTAISSCSTDCSCISLFGCLADAGISGGDLGANSLAAAAGCIPGGLTSATALLNDPGINDVYTCFTVTCASACALPSPDASVDAGMTGDNDAGATTDSGVAPDGG